MYKYKKGRSLSEYKISNEISKIRLVPFVR